jgi:hypothetical protein
MNLLDQDWCDYVTKQMPETAGPIQRYETKKAFLCGANALLEHLQKASLRQEIIISQDVLDETTLDLKTLYFQALFIDQAAA